MYWDGALLNRDLSTDPARLRGELEDAAVLVSNLEINRHAANWRTFSAGAPTAGVRTLFLVARSISPEAMSVLVLNNNAGTHEDLGGPPRARAGHDPR